MMASNSALMKSGPKQYQILCQHDIEMYYTCLPLTQESLPACMQVKMRLLS